MAKKNRSPENISSKKAQKNSEKPQEEKVRPVATGNKTGETTPTGTKNADSVDQVRPGKDRFLNYEMSWLKFNWRVLAEALNEDNPLLERVKFIGIVCSNLDEFFQKRVGGLKRQLLAGVRELSVDGRTPEEQLREVRKDVLRMIGTYRDCYFNELLPGLEKEGIRIEKYRELGKSEKENADHYFEKQLYPIITPLAVDEAHPFPFISNKSRSFAIRLKEKGNKDVLFARLKIPSNRPRWIDVRKKSGDLVLVSISDIIRENIDRFFPGLEVLSAHIFRVTRNADIERNEEEADDLLEVIEEELRERRFADVVRVELDARAPKELKKYLTRQLGIRKTDLFEMNGPLGLADSIQLYDVTGFDHLKFERWTPALHPVFRHRMDEDVPDFFEVIQRGDFLVHHPYYSFESSTQRFVEAASEDPNVLAIKQTLYRTSQDSPVMHALIRAAESGKQVAVLVELKARFDEERNISWAHKLEKAGVHVSYGLPGLKIHAKQTIVVRDEEDGVRRYVHIGTGNYHPDTAQLYEDLGFFTCDEEIASDVTDIFNKLTGYAPQQRYGKLLVAPVHMRHQLVELIDREIGEARQGRKAHIIAKMNSLEDKLIIEKLYEASDAGVVIELIVRGVCRLIPQKKGLSENIRVMSVIGRFLEHSRLYYFYSGGNDVYLTGSADWMNRNLDARVEVLTPVEDAGLKKYLKQMLAIYLNDNSQRWILKPSGTYVKVTRGKKEESTGTHRMLMQHTRQQETPLPVSSGFQ